ncbi:hypothetical protein GGU46_002176 [Hymenobacter latericoloratus]|nr:hypothetical protein [Hymenobacter latericoloratus]
MTWGGKPTWWQHVMKALLSWPMTLSGATLQGPMPSYVFVALILFNGFCWGVAMYLLLRGLRSLQHAFLG